MTKIGSTDRPVYFGLSSEGLPADPIVDGAVCIFLDNGQAWCYKNNAWLVRPLELSLDIPLGGLPDSVQIPSASGGYVNRQVVTIGAGVSGQLMPSLELAIERMVDQNTLILTELRVLSILLQGLNTMPVTDDLDQLRAFVLANEESITR